MKSKTETETVFSGLIDEQGDLSRDIDLSKYDFMPFGGRLLVRKFKPDDMSVGGLHLPKDAQQEKNWGEVVKLPETATDIGVRVGDLILFIDGAGSDLEALGDSMVLLDYKDDFENDILGVFRPKS